MPSIGSALGVPFIDGEAGPGPIPGLDVKAFQDFEAVLFQDGADYYQFQDQ